MIDTSEVAAWVKNNGELAKYTMEAIVALSGWAWGIYVRIKAKSPKNIPTLHIHATGEGLVNIPGAEGCPCFRFHFRNAGHIRIYITRVYFKPAQRHFWTLGFLKRTKLQVHRLSYRISQLNAYELKFRSEQNTFVEYETVLNSGPSNQGEMTWLPLSEAALPNDISEKRCGTLYVEYAMSGNQGTHVERL